MDQTIESTGCCELIKPELWQEKEVVWDNKMFVKDHITSIFHIPLNFSGKVVKNMKLIKEAGAEMASLSGTFLTKVFEGPYQNAGKWATEMKEYVKSKGKELQKIYFFYTACPKCAKAYGKNYVVLLAQVK
ncbi:hypothetical protein A2121_00055 [Candidatus Nomurabacteria bacterium GWB1_40_6]|uniref:Uncharacterized protein n=1 Tax=Candidatus Nomurabacteria bacterium GWB1_40_6 TaxID=1801727 RepID=A0A1F6TNX5_9BACT|nr:MAG: hypothetical protein A2121_00055 [Candidatus Nomurabacteria bacterium GWB1_40_6]